jgi:hypothetical protein
VRASGHIYLIQHALSVRSHSATNAYLPRRVHFIGTLARRVHDKEREEGPEQQQSKIGEPAEIAAHTVRHQPCSAIIAETGDNLTLNTRRKFC